MATKPKRESSSKTWGSPRYTWTTKLNIIYLLSMNWGIYLVFIMLGLCSLHVSTSFMALLNDQKSISCRKLNLNESVIKLFHQIFYCSIARKQNKLVQRFVKPLIVIIPFQTHPVTEVWRPFQIWNYYWTIPLIHLHEKKNRKIWEPLVSHRQCQMNSDIWILWLIELSW